VSLEKKICFIGFHLISLNICISEVITKTFINLLSKHDVPLDTLLQKESYFCNSVSKDV
jgi:hypothetical protein